MIVWRSFENISRYQEDQGRINDHISENRSSDGPEVNNRSK